MVQDIIAGQGNIASPGIIAISVIIASPGNIADPGNLLVKFLSDIIYNIFLVI